MIIWQTGRILTWAHFEVVRISRKPGTLLAFFSAGDVLMSGVRINETKFPLVPYLLRRSDAPLGLAIPPLLSLRLSSHFIGLRMLKLPTMAPADSYRKTWK